MSISGDVTPNRSSPAISRRATDEDLDKRKFSKHPNNSCWGKIAACWSSCCPCCCTKQNKSENLAGKIKRMDSTVGDLPTFGPPQGKFTGEDENSKNHQPSITSRIESTSYASDSKLHNVSVAEHSGHDLPSTYENATTQDPQNGADSADLPSVCESTNSFPTHKAPPPSPKSKSVGPANPNSEHGDE